MVGPCHHEWKVLGETEGERFVVLKKGPTFQGQFADCEKENRAEELVWRLRIFFM